MNKLDHKNVGCNLNIECDENIIRLKTHTGTFASFDAHTAIKIIDSLNYIMGQFPEKDDLSDAKESNQG